MCTKNKINKTLLTFYRSHVITLAADLAQLTPLLALAMLASEAVGNGTPFITISFHGCPPK